MRCFLRSKPCNDSLSAPHYSLNSVSIQSCSMLQPCMYKRYMYMRMRFYAHVLHVVSMLRTRTPHLLTHTSSSSTSAASAAWPRPFLTTAFAFILLSINSFRNLQRAAGQNPDPTHSLRMAQKSAEQAQTQARRRCSQTRTSLSRRRTCPPSCPLAWPFSPPARRLRRAAHQQLHAGRTRRHRPG